MPRRIALASGILLFISLLATSSSFAQLAFSSGTITPTPASGATTIYVCSGNSATVTFTAGSLPSGSPTWTASYQWESSPNNVTWTAISGASGTMSGSSPVVSYVTPILTFAGPGCGPTTYYRLQLTSITNSFTGPNFTSSITNFTVCANPSAITGPTSVCQGNTITLSDATSGGTWTSSNTAIASADSLTPTTGTVTGVSGGSAIVTYTVSHCTDTILITVNPKPSVITGDSVVCERASITVFDSLVGGGWSVVGGTVHLAINPLGIVGGLEAASITGNSAGTNLITYTSNMGCTRTKQITVNPAPTISGVLNICQFATTSLSGSPTGGTWLSGSPSVATIGGSSGVAFGVAAGTSFISYTDPVFGCLDTAILSVTAAPLPITGTFSVCVGATTTLASGPPGGTWGSSAIATATVSSTGVVTGVSSGTVVITYLNPTTTCYVTQIVTVAPLPLPITGTLALCEGGNTTTLSSGTPGGTWASSVGAVAAIGGTNGVVVSGIAGTTFISYTLPTGCFDTAIFTTNPLPTGITGSLTTCANSTTTVNGTPGGGSFSTSAPTSIIASITSGGVIVAGASTGTATITYALPTGCFITAVVTVTPASAPITGTFNVCAGDCTSLSHAVGGGTWASSNPAVGTINASGVACGVSGGTTNITYTEPGGCISVATLTVTALPSAITGPTSVCVGATITLANSTPGGTWSASSGIVTVGATTGAMTGVTGGVTNITYSLTAVSNCFVTRPLTVNAAPATIIASPSSSVCVGSTITLSSATTGGTWSTSTPGIASVNPSTGVVTGVSTAGGGIGTITYTASGCSTTTTVNVFATPTILGAPYVVCPGTTLSLAGIPGGGTWVGTNGTGTIIVFNPSGTVTGVTPGTATVTYTAGTCPATITVTINSLPDPIVATSTNICVGVTSTLTNATTGGTWTSGNTSIATVSPGGIVTGVAGGTVNITYTVTATGCYSWLTLTVDPLLPAITGASHVCLNSTTVLSNTTTGGTWTSSVPTNASIDLSTGLVTGLHFGTTTISYSTASGCLATMLFTVDSLPTITPASATICLGSTVTLAGSPTGGTWSATSGNVSVGTSTGVVTGVAAGTADVTYTAPSTGCTATATVTVNALPLPNAPHGPVCSGDSITLTNPTPGGGTWSSTSPIVTVNPTTGVVLAGSAGTAIVTFTAASTGCSIYDTLTVNVGPGTINGLSVLCAGDSTLLIASPSGGFWTAPPGIVATVNPITGMVHAMPGAGGVATITYTLPSGCFRTHDITVNPLPSAIVVAPVCVGSTTFASSAPGGGTWSATPSAVAFIDPSTGALTGLSTLGAPFALTTITYTLPTGCAITAIDTIWALPSPIVGDTQICAGFPGVLTSTPAGGTWTSSFPPILTINSSTGTYTTAPGGGTVTVTYVDPHSCAVSRVVTVNPIPPAIVGDSFLCRGDTVTWTDITTGGTWTSANITVATVGSASGLVTGVWSNPTPATTTITYTLPTGCYTTKVVTVNPNPQPITGPMQMCSGTCVTLNVLSTATGSWSSLNTSVATTLATGPLQAQVCGTNLTLLPDTATIRFTVAGTGCFASTVVTVFPNPGPILGDDSVCVGSSTTFSNIIPGGTWSLTLFGTAVAVINSTTGVVSTFTPGTVAVHYTVWPTGCNRDTILTIFPPPAPITGDSVVCQGDSIFVSNATPGGSFSTAPGGHVTITPSGTVFGVSAGTATITYTASTGCFSIKVITVNPLPGAIGGPKRICLNDSAIKYNTTIPGGSWTVSPGGIVTLTSVSIAGDTVKIKGVVPGTVMLTYTLPTGCFVTDTFTVDSLPQPILGVGAMCLNDCVKLYNVTSVTNGAGSWTWTNLTGIINLLPDTSSFRPDSALVCGLGAGTALITYTEPRHGCKVTREVTVNPLPTAITGPTRVCEGFSDTLRNVTPGGHWTTSDATIATVDTNGVVTGHNSGVVIISYVLNATGCYITRPFTVDSTPNVTVNHPAIKCRKTSVSLTASGATNYVWNPTSGLSCTTCPNPTATPTITTTYTVTGTTTAGCADTAVVTVIVDTLLNDIRITGRDTICTGMCDTLVAVGFHGSLFSWIPPAGLSCTVCDTTIACPTGDAIYMAVAIDSFGCRDTATFNIRVMPLPHIVYSPNPPFVCYGKATQVTVEDLNATSTYPTKFAWFPNAMISCDTCPSPFIFDTFSLVYRVIGISPFGCYDSIKIPVSVLKDSKNTISKDTVVCPDICVQLRSSSINPDGSTSTWQWFPTGTLNNSTIPNPIACPKSTTTYTLVISPNVCFHDTETVTIGVSPLPQIEITPKSQQVVAGTPIPLSAVITNDVLITSYAWSPAKSLSCEVCYNTIATPTFTTTYVFTATSNYGCTSSDSVRFTTTCDNSQIYIANTFTPNGDGVNDRFFISGKGISSITNFLIVNRWGEVVFEAHNIMPNDPGAGWDGTYKGLVVPPDVFMYIVDATCELGSPLKYTGDVSIVR